MLNVGTGYLTNTVWFDPSPSTRTAPIPANKIDAQSVFLHEIGHMLAFNGFRNGTTGTLPGNYQSTYDRQTTFDGANFYFGGANVQSVYGGPVPLTYGNIAHVGNNSPRPGADLIPDLMNGVVYYYQNRYFISELDLAIMADTGIQIVPVPEPAGLVVLGGGALALLRVGRRRGPVGLAA